MSVDDSEIPDIRRDAINAVLAMNMKRPCWCEWADIGVGSHRVHEHPECPTHTEAGATIWHLENLADRLAEGLHRLAHEEWYGPFRAGFRAAIHAVRKGRLPSPADE